MRIIVSDTSCMIDLRKAALLESALTLPFSFVMPNTLFEDEWLDLSADIVAFAAAVAAITMGSGRWYAGNRTTFQRFCNKLGKEVREWPDLLPHTGVLQRRHVGVPPLNRDNRPGIAACP